MTYETKVKTGYYWADKLGGERRRGVRIERGRSHAWFPDEDVLAVANALADYLEQQNHGVTYTTTSNDNPEDNPR